MAVKALISDLPSSLRLAADDDSTANRIARRQLAKASLTAEEKDQGYVKVHGFWETSGYDEILLNSRWAISFM